jgi:type IV secretory pathway VirB10-like protein
MAAEMPVLTPQGISLGKVVFIVAAAIVILGGGGVAAWYYTAKDIQDELAVRMAGFEGVSDSSLYSWNPEPEIKPEPEAAPPPPPPPVPTAERINSNVSPPPLPNPQTLFGKPIPASKDNFADQFNAARRGNPSINVNVDGSGVTAKTEDGLVMSQLEWNEERTNASLPVKLDRVVPVDRFIDAVLINEINSELGGKVVAQVERHVYGQHGNNVLIPAGSKAVGYYNPLEKAGDSRIMIYWNRIITPEGINIHVEDAEMADGMGRAGITGNVDNRYFERYGLALLVSTIQAATAYALPVENDSQKVVVESYGSGAAGLSKTILDNNINLKPIVEIPAGSSIKISVMRDIWFKKPIKGNSTAVALADTRKGGLK